MRLKIYGNSTDRSSHILCSKKYARRKVSVPLRCNATGSKSLALFPLLASSKTSSEAQSSRNFNDEETCGESVYCIHSAVSPMDSNNNNNTNQRSHATYWCFRSRFFHASTKKTEWNQATLSSCKLQTLDIGTHLESASVSLSIMER